MITIFSKADLTVTRSQVSDWLKNDEDAEQQPCDDTTLACFLNGLIIEMRDKMDLLTDNVTELSAKTAKKTKASTDQRNTMQEAISALVALGYRPADASRLLGKVYEDDVSCETLIRLALREVAVW